MRSKLTASTVFAVAVLLAGIGALEAADRSFGSVSPQKAIEILSIDKTAIVLDVRTAEEFDGPLGHLKDAKLIPVQVLGQRMDELGKYKDKTILVICLSGGRSLKAAGMLSRRGFSKVLNVEQGMRGMNNIPNAPIERK